MSPERYIGPSGGEKLSVTVCPLHIYEGELGGEPRRRCKGEGCKDGRRKEVLSMLKKKILKGGSIKLQTVFTRFF